MNERGSPYCPCYLVYDMSLHERAVCDHVRNQLKLGEQPEDLFAPVDAGFG